MIAARIPLLLALKHPLQQLLLLLIGAAAVLVTGLDTSDVFAILT